MLQPMLVFMIHWHQIEDNRISSDNRLAYSLTSGRNSITRLLNPPIILVPFIMLIPSLHTTTVYVFDVSA